MRYVLVFVLVIVASTATVAYGGKKNNPSRETTLLASEVAGKIVSRPGTTVSVTAPDSCRLHISFESVNASFDLPLQGSTVSLADAEDERGVAAIVDGLVDPIGTFYRFGLGGSLLGRAK